MSKWFANLCIATLTVSWLAFVIYSIWRDNRGSRVELLVAGSPPIGDNPDGD